MLKVICFLCCDHNGILDPIRFQGIFKWISYLTPAQECPTETKTLKTVAVKFYRSD